MSSITQRKIPEDKLRLFYLDKAMPDRTIADKLKCTKQAVYLARKKFGINKLTRTERNSKLINVTSFQESILRGSLLGDAYVAPDGAFSIEHGSKQFGYLTWLFKNLQPYFSEIRNSRTCKRIRSCSHSFGLKIRKEHYVDGRKIITSKILNKLDSLGIAVWFMDDGQVLPSGKQARLSTCSFSKEENELICTYFKNRWKIDCRVGYNGKYPQIEFNKDNTLKLIDLIHPHIPLTMRYKIRPVVGLSVYLSGGMEHKKNLGEAWRDFLTTTLKPLNISTINPITLETSEEACAGFLSIQDRLTQLKAERKFSEVRSLSREVLFPKDMLGIQRADATVLYYDKSVQKGAGTLSEAWESFREGRPVYLVTDFDIQNIPAWLIGETTQIFHNFEELIEYISDHARVVCDQENAQQISENILGAVYK